MDKYTALKEAISILSPNYEAIIDRYTKNANKYGKKELNTSGHTFLQSISQKEYNLLSLGYSASTISRLLKELFPGRTSVCKPCTYILDCVGYKYCSYCEEVKSIDYFRKNTLKSTGVQSLCKVCHAHTTGKTQAARQSEYRASKLNRTPSWADLPKIKEFYANCPKGYHVDHVLPLNGEHVSGLHVLNNLQYLSAEDNCKKSNKCHP